MFYATLITVILFIIDLLLLTFMVHFNFFIGIPIFKRKFMINSKKSLEDMGTYVDQNKHLVYKISDKDIIFRSEFKFAFFWLYLVRIFQLFSIIKGDIKIVNGRAIVTQRISLSSIFYICFAIYGSISATIYIKGYVYFSIVLLLLIIFLIYRKQNARINEVCNNIIKYMN